MKVEQTFWIGAPPDAKLTPRKAAIARQAPGTVVTGEVVGQGTLKPGDIVINGEHRFPIQRLEAFRQNLEKLEPPRNVGLVLGTDVDKDLFGEGHELRFQRPSP